MLGQEVLIGAPGAGKSCVAKGLAQRIACDYADVDAIVTRELGGDLDGCFVAAGEQNYRHLEREVCRALLSEPHNGIIALSSGAVDHADVRELLTGKRVIWLKVGPAQIMRRKQMNATISLAPLQVRSTLIQQLAVRDELYAALAQHTIDVDSLSLDEVLDAVQGLVESV